MAWARPRGLARVGVVGMGKYLLLTFWCGLLGLGFLYKALDREVADLEIRETISRTPNGKIFRNFAPGQLFRCDFRDLQRLDVWVIPQGGAPETGLILELREVPQDQTERFLAQPVVRSARMETSMEAGGPRWGVFRFEAIPDSKGKLYHWKLQPEDGQRDLAKWAPFVSLRSTVGAHSRWGNGYTTDPDPLRFRSMYGNLSAIGIGVDGLDAAAGESYIEVWQEPVDGREPFFLRKGVLHHQAPTASGYAFFTFDPIPESRYKFLRVDLHLPDNARVLRMKDHELHPDSVTGISYHGVGTPPAELLGQTLGTVRLPQRDLVFRAFGEDGIPSNWNKVVQRGARTRFVLALLLGAFAASGALFLVWRRD